MDNGEELAMLNEPWMFLGIKLNEWIAGLMVMLLIIAITGATSPGIMPIVLLAGLATAFSTANLRKKFPDEERGVMNYFMVYLGFAPPGIPTPAVLQPFWSAGRVAKLKPSTRYEELGLDELFLKEEER